MAVTNTTVLAGYTSFIADTTATADGDTSTGNIAHGLGAQPLMGFFTQLISQALTALSAWALTTFNTTDIVGTKLASTGSGNASAQVRWIAMLPHSIIK